MKAYGIIIILCLELISLLFDADYKNVIIFTLYNKMQQLQAYWTCVKPR